MRDCLQKASKDSCFSILFCALGTGGLRYPAEDVAAVMYSKVIEFDTANPDTTLKEVKFILYQKDTTTIQVCQTSGIELRHDKTNNVAVRPVKTQLSISIHPF